MVTENPRILRTNIQLVSLDLPEGQRHEAHEDISTKRRLPEEVLEELVLDIPTGFSSIREAAPFLIVLDHPSPERLYNTLISKFTLDYIAKLGKIITENETRRQEMISSSKEFRGPRANVVRVIYHTTDPSEAKYSRDGRAIAEIVLENQEAMAVDDVSFSILDLSKFLPSMSRAEAETYGNLFLYSDQDDPSYLYLDKYSK